MRLHLFADADKSLLSEQNFHLFNSFVELYKLEFESLRIAPEVFFFAFVDLQIVRSIWTPIDFLYLLRKFFVPLASVGFG